MRTKFLIFGVVMLAGILFFITGEALAFSDEPCSRLNYDDTHACEPQVGMMQQIKNGMDH